MKKNKAARWVRGGLLSLLLFLVTYESIAHQILGGSKSPSIHALCPYGALESLYALLISGSFIQKIYSGTLILLVITIVIAILFRRSFCGLLCPFGALQELFARIGRKILGKRLIVPVKLDNIFRYLKYAILILTLFMAWRLGRLWMTSFDPYAAYGHITAIPATLVEDPLSIIGFILLGITLLGSVLYDRFFCKYLCPAGAFYALIGKISPTKVVRNADVCINCNLCTKVCPVNLDVAKMESVTSAECLNCNECVAVCPKKGALEIKTFRKAVSPLAMIAIVAALFFLPIFITQATGIYQVIPKAVKAGETIGITEIKGSMSIADAEIAVGLPDETFRSVMGIPASVPSRTLMKGISAIVAGYDFDAAKEEAAELLNPSPTPVSSTTATTLPGSATVSVPAAKTDVSVVKGSMTITAAAAATGLAQADFYQLFKIPASVSASTLMKDIGNVVASYNFDAIKTSLK